MDLTRSRTLASLLRECQRSTALLMAIVGALAHTSAHAVTAADGRWHPGIGDPTFMGWFTVVVYGLACWLCLQCALRLRPQVFWWTVTLALLALGINKQLDLQTWVTEMGRDMAQHDGWYGRRHDIQIAFIIGVTGAGAAVACLLGWALQGYWRRYLRVWSGLVLLLTFIVVRAASFHHVDQFLMADIGGLRMNWVFELGGLALIASGAWRAGKRTRKNPQA